jgi:AcrR family transcriptional regulator
VTRSDAELLDAALEAFAERGYDGTSMRELARSLGVSHNLLPQRFGSKERIWYLAVDHGFGTLAAHLADAASGAPLDDLTRLRAMVLGFVEANAARPALLRIINQEAAAPGPRLDHLFDRYIGPVGEAGTDLLSRLHDRGEITTSSPALLYFLMTHGAGAPFALPSLAERFGRPVDPHDPAAIRAWAEMLVDAIFDGIVVR